MLRDALQYLVEVLAPVGCHKVADDEYVERTLHLPPAETTAKSLVVSSLNSVVSYLAQNRDQLALDRHLVHVVEHDTVQLLGTLAGRHRQREIALVAKAALPSFPFGSYMDMETFNIGLQSAFLPGDGRATVLSVSGRVVAGSELQQADDGVKQNVTVRKGIELLETAKVTNPVTLQPFRTFVEVEQPASAFVFRLREAPRGEGIEAALFEADGGAWKVEARKAVAEFLTTALRSAGVGDVEVIW